MNAQKILVASTDCFVDTSFLLLLRKQEKKETLRKFRRINPWPFLAFLLFFAALLSLQRLYLDSRTSNNSVSPTIRTSANLSLKIL